jgi:hypothetical protein
LARPADTELFPGPDQMTPPGSLDPEGKVNTGQYRSDSDLEYFPAGRPAEQNDRETLTDTTRPDN